MSMYLGNDEPTQEYAVEALSELITIQSIQVHFVNPGPAEPCYDLILQTV